MRPKNIIISLVYLLSMFLLASPRFIGIFTRGLPLTLLGVVIMLVLTGCYGMFMFSSVFKKPAIVINADTLPAKESEPDKYRRLAEWFFIFGHMDDAMNLRRLSADISAAYSDELLRNNPFRNTELGDRLQEAAADIAIKYDQTVKILSEAFERGDITYQNYISVLDDVMKLSAAYLRSIKKRLCVFDYRTWAADRNDEMCVKYIEEVNRSVIQLEGIEGRFDTLIHELVCLDEISEAPLTDMQTLIETTSDYKSLDE